MKGFVEAEEGAKGVAEGKACGARRSVPAPPTDPAPPEGNHSQCRAFMGLLGLQLLITTSLFLSSSPRGFLR